MISKYSYEPMASRMKFNERVFTRSMSMNGCIRFFFIRKISENTPKELGKFLGKNFYKKNLRHCILNIHNVYYTLCTVYTQYETVFRPKKSQILKSKTNLRKLKLSFE